MNRIALFRKSNEFFLNDYAKNLPSNFSIHSNLKLNFLRLLTRKNVVISMELQLGFATKGKETP